MGRSKSGFGSNEAGFSYYFSYYIGNMTHTLTVYRVALCLLIPAVIILFVVKVAEDRKESKITLLQSITGCLFHRDVMGIALWILLPFLAFSVVRTKLLWYQYPVITALLIAAAIATGVVCEKKKIPLMIQFGMGAATVITAFYFSYSLFQTFETYGTDGYMTNSDTGCSCKSGFG